MRRGVLVAGAYVGLALSRGAWAAALPLPKTLPPASLWRSESFTVPYRGVVLRISIALPVRDDPRVRPMLRGIKPVPVYVMDGVIEMPMMAVTTRMMQWSGELPPCTCIGIDYHDADRALEEEWRKHDLTIDQGSGVVAMSPPKDGWGGGPKFYEFLMGTIRPTIEDRYDVDAARSTLVGHSLGGLFTIDAMVRSPTSFGNYLAISPSLGFQSSAALARLRKELEAETRFPSRVGVVVGEQEDRISGSGMTSRTLEFGALVAKHRSQFPNGAMVSVIPRATHHSVLGEAMSRGMRFLLSPEERRSETF